MVAAAWGSVEAAGKPEAEPTAAAATQITPAKPPTQPGARSGDRTPTTRPWSRAQLGRPPRAIHAVGHRCPCGNPDVVATEPRLDGRHAVPDDLLPDLPARRVADRDARGVRPDAGDDRAAGDDAELAAAYRRAHEAYLAAREAIGEVPEIAGVSAGGMPDRVKCLHVLAGQALAQGRGVNPLGDEVLDAARRVVGRRARASRRGSRP